MLQQSIKQDPAPLTDAALAGAIGSGDGNAFEVLMRRHNRMLYRAARSIMKDDAEAEDVLQEAYLLAYRNIGKFRGDARLSTWLTRIVVNEALGRLRKRAHRAEVIRLESDCHDDNPDLDTMMPDNDREQPETAAIRMQARRLLQTKIDALPDAFRTVFVLRAVEEMPVEEVALALQIPEATVRSRYFRAKGLLREALAQEFDHALEDTFSFDGARCDRIVASVLSRLIDLSE